LKIAIPQNQKTSVIVTITQNCVIKYIQLTHKKIPNSYEKTQEH